MKGKIFSAILILSVLSTMVLLTACLPSSAESGKQANPFAEYSMDDLLKGYKIKQKLPNMFVVEFLDSKADKLWPEYDRRKQKEGLTADYWEFIRDTIFEGVRSVVNSTNNPKNNPKLITPLPGDWFSSYSRGVIVILNINELQ